MITPQQPTFRDLFTPKLVSALREGYDAGKFRKDFLAGLSVAIVALPLSMAIAIGSGAPPERGLFAAIVGGFLISLLGGSRYQIGGPAGAFIVLVSAALNRHGIDGLLLATLLAGIFLVAVGYLRLGTYIRYIPHPVIIGFTAAIGVIIFTSQLRDLFGLKLAGAEPADLWLKLQTLWSAIGTFNPYAAFIAALTVALITGIREWRPALPSLLIAVVTASLLVYLLKLPVETIGTRFGGIPNSLPAPAVPAFSLEKIRAVLPDALSFAILGGIESLLSAVVADGMTGRRHRSNCELVAQGIANIGSALFGGLVVTGTIARTATNVRAGAVTPLSGIFHAVFLLAAMLVAASLMIHIPLAALAGVLAVVSWGMIEKTAIAGLLRARNADALILLATFLVTIFEDLMAGIAVGVVMGSLVFMHRMASLVAVEAGTSNFAEDQADFISRARPDGQETFDGTEQDAVVYRLSGPLFFGSASTVGTVLERIGHHPKLFVLDFSAVPFVDTPAAEALQTFIKRCRSQNVMVALSGVAPAIRHFLHEEGIPDTMVHFVPSIAAAHDLLKAK